MPNTSIPRSTLQKDVAAMNGLNQVADYQPNRPEASPEALQNAHQNMIEKQRIAKEQDAIAKDATAAARQAEHDFHDAVVAMRESVKGQFGSNSKEAASIGCKIKENRPNTKRKPK
jgi:hypothetical protein